MELWQLDVVGGFLLADGSHAKALTGVDDHSRFCVSAKLMVREHTQAVCAGFAAALRAHGVPAQVLTPRSTWSDGSAYDAQAARLARLFADNFKTFETEVAPDVRAAGPKA